MKALTGWIIILCSSAALVGGFFMLKGATSGESLDIQLATTTFPVLDDEGKSAAPPQAEPPTSAPAGYKEYRNKQFGFSLYYPPEFKPQETVDHGPELTVAFQGAPGEPGFQVYVSPIDNDRITPERFRRDMPSGVKKNEREAKVGGVPAVAFFGFDAAVGDTREIWFIKDHFLYEVTTYKSFDEWLAGILRTWRFIERDSGQNAS